jgi:hypothetical protein
MMSHLCNRCVRELLVLTRTWFAFGLPSKQGVTLWDLFRPSQPSRGRVLVHHGCIQNHVPLRHFAEQPLGVIHSFEPNEQHGVPRGHVALRVRVPVPMRGRPSNHDP